MLKKTSILARMQFKMSWNRMIQRKKFFSFVLAYLVFSMIMFTFIFENREDPSVSYGDLIKNNFSGFVHTYYAAIFFSGLLYYMMFGSNSHSSFFHSNCAFLPICLRSFYTLDLITTQVNPFSVLALPLLIHLYLLSPFHVQIHQGILWLVWTLFYLTWISCFSSILSTCISTIPFFGRFSIRMKYYIPFLFGTLICIIQLRGIKTNSPFLQVVGPDHHVPGISAFSSTANALIDANRPLFRMYCFWEAIVLFTGTLWLHMMIYNKLLMMKEPFRSSRRTAFIQIDSILSVLRQKHSSSIFLHLKEFFYLIRSNAILSYFIACMAVSFFYFRLYFKPDLVFIGKAGMILASPLLFAGMVYIQFLYDEKGSLNYYFNPLEMKIWVNAKHSALLTLCIINLAFCSVLYWITTKDALNLLQMIYLILVTLYFWGFFAPLMTRHTIRNPWKARYRQLYIQHNNIRNNTYQFILLIAILLPVFLVSVFFRDMKVLFMILLIMSGGSLAFYCWFNQRWDRLFYSNQDNYLHDTLED
ncbi:MAG: hypothetical protein JXR49_05140 [Acidobacteria bacterium]|nr:hypothetical protein [Acidobacteriota bacterium]